MWTVYNRTPKRYLITADSTFLGELEREWCGSDKLSETIGRFVDKYKDDRSVEVHAYESLNIDWEEK